MDRASSLIFPGSKTLAGWWRQLAPHRPQALSVGYAFVHRIEAAVQVVRFEPLDPLAHLVLHALTLEGCQPFATVRLRDRLHLPEHLIQQITAALVADGLLDRRDSGALQATATGVQALSSQSVTRQAMERRVFPFVERVDSVGQRRGPPTFLPLTECGGTVWQVDDAHRFDIADLRSNIGLSAHQKNMLGFPHDVKSLAAESDVDAWQQVIVDCPERVLLAVVRNATEMLGFAAKVESWTLGDHAPALRLDCAATMAWPEVAAEMPIGVFQATWRDWCRQRSMPTSEVEACVLKFESPRLIVQPPPRLLQRLQAAKSDLLKGDAWVLVGDGYVRQAVQLVVK